MAGLAQGGALRVVLGGAAAYFGAKTHVILNTLSLRSKLPNVGTTIFTVMSKMAAKYGAINLSQGFPNFPVAPELIDLVAKAMRDGHNQYAPMPGWPPLLEAIAAKTEGLYGQPIDPMKEITVTAGATEAIFATIMALVQEGDEVIVLEPAYDCYVPAIELAGAKPVFVSLRVPEFSISWKRVKEAITPRTKMIIVNTPGNPTGAVISAEDLVELEALAEKEDLLVLGDEVYEHIIFEEQEHMSMQRLAQLRQRSISVFSFGKTFHATGWKVGYLIAPPHLTEEIRKVHQYLTFSVNTPTQVALAEYLQNPANYENLGSFYQQKRDLFLELMDDSRFEPIPCYGSYFQLFYYRHISDEPDMEFAEALTKERGVAAIPVSSFYHNGNDPRLLRFCFAKDDDTLRQAAKVLCKI